MIITDLSLKNFRNYDNLDFKSGKYINVLKGRNAQGKTNLLEALYILASSKSFRVRDERELLKWKESFAEINARLEYGDGRIKNITVRWLLNAQGVLERRISVNDAVVKKLGIFLGEVLLTLFMPGDLNLIQGAPAYRRRFLDVLLCKISRTYYDFLSKYREAQRQKSGFIREKAREAEFYGDLPAKDRTVLDSLDTQISALGGGVIYYRILLLEYLQATAAAFYGRLSGESGDLLKLSYKSKALYADSDTVLQRLKYLSELPAKEHFGGQGPDTELLNDIRKSFSSSLKDRYERLLLKNSVIIGPHVDDFSVDLSSSRNLKYFGSQGQHRSAVLALRMAEAEIMAEINGEKAIILLDDCFSELDEDRIRFLISYLTSLESQVFITTAQRIFFDHTDRQKIKLFEVSSGRIGEA